MGNNNCCSDEKPDDAENIVRRPSDIQKLPYKDKEKKGKEILEKKDEQTFDQDNNEQSYPAGLEENVRKAYPHHILIKMLNFLIGKICLSKEK